ncbi:hypothetical protein ACFQ3F_15515 [Nocardioides ginsengisoli]|uniref:Uncharacterized protein n=1 Tax=Nocardioides ginsengisoli TaxID=363868 RepID=A0ABW3W291_9ACTN
MKMNSLRRVLLLVVALVASTLSLVGLSSAPASADTFNGTAEVRATVAVRQGGTATVQGRVTFVAPDSQRYYVLAGTATLQQLAYGASAWTTVSSQTITQDTEDLTWTVRPAKNTQYRVVYSGGTYTWPDSSTDSWNPATSAAVTVGVARNLNDKYTKRTHVFQGKVAAYGRKIVVIQKSTCADPKSASCKWKTYKKLRTSAKGAWSLKLPFNRTNTHFRAVVKAGSGYITSYSTWVISTRRY